MNKRLRRKKLLDQGWFIEGVKKDLSKTLPIKKEWKMTLKEVQEIASPRLLNQIRYACDRQDLLVNHKITIESILMIDEKLFKGQRNVGAQTVTELVHLKEIIKMRGYVGD